ncbi:MAG: excinuclease ABC subunit C, partial [Actinobacteria bacterium]|nr:excinuclease ABC subunit C [Actinomycetota bacterium]NIS28595.1 excinuclease ABC subunit C [Actinomycetota bacterium]NIT94032.1 excinuclease ABC subunit C [Actinomycetota bacterium]NIU17664.1 excinuclease ABC subunit C [Actinomycetota bacterium]NIU64060.1 excinuclease ABC subunit C [Actinomycetota bacterium]
SRNEDVDVIGLADDELEAAVQVFFVRKGRVMGRRGFVVDKAEDLDPGELVSRVLERLYFDDNPIGSPKEVLVPDL